MKACDEFMKIQKLKGCWTNFSTNAEFFLQTGSNVSFDPQELKTRYMYYYSNLLWTNLRQDKLQLRVKTQFYHICYLRTVKNKIKLEIKLKILQTKRTCKILPKTY